MVRVWMNSVSLFRCLSLATCMRGGNVEMMALRWGVLDVSVPPPRPWPDPGLSQDCCPLCHASPCWLWSGDCRYNVDCSQCVFKDQNNNGICSAHSLMLIDHLSSVSLPLWSHQLCLESSLTQVLLERKMKLKFSRTWGANKSSYLLTQQKHTTFCSAKLNHLTSYWEERHWSGDDVVSCVTAAGSCCVSAQW